MFINAEIDICPAFGWQGGPTFNTRVVTLQSWVERRNANNIQCRHNYSLPWQNIPSDEYLKNLKQVFLAVRGQLHSFKVKDFNDFVADDETFFEGDGVTKVFQLSKISTWGAASYTRIITKPSPTIAITVDDVAAAPTVDYLTGLVTFVTAPTLGSLGRWSGEFRVPVRFNSDVLNTTIDAASKAQGLLVNGSIEVIEVFGE